jgi:drug/metabolite transporter, DME family
MADLTLSADRKVASEGVPITTSLVGLGAGVVWSLGALFARLADSITTWQYLIWRSIAIIVVIETLNRIRGRRSPLVRAYTEGWLMFAGCVSLLLASIGFVYAVKNTSAANAAFLASLSPMIAAVLGRVFLGERLTRVTIGAIGLSLIGLVIMLLADSGGGNVRGNIGAVSSSFGFALYTLCLRRDQTRNWDPVMPGYAVMMIIICSTISLSQGKTLVPDVGDIAWAVLHGGVLITVGTLMYNKASKVIPAVAMTVFAQTEMVFVPIWIFLKFSERPKVATLLGGGLILVAVVGKAVLDSQSGKARSARSARLAG